MSYEEETLHRNYPLTLHDEEDTCVSYEEVSQRIVPV